MSELSLQDLADRTGESLERLSHWRSLGFFGSEGSDTFTLEDLGRVQMVQLTLRSGFDTPTVEAKAVDLRERFDRFMGRLRPPVRAYTLEEAAGRLGIDVSELRPLWDAAGLAEPFEEVGDQDLAVMAGLRYATSAGLPEEALVQLARVYVDALRRVAEAEVRLFHIYVHDRLRSAGLTGRDLDDSVEETSSRIEGFVEPTVLYFHERAWKRAFREDLLLHVAEALGVREDTGVPGQITGAVVFVDLSSFTPLTDVMGDEKAAEVINRFSGFVRDAVRTNGGRVVKQIGDAFMLLFNDASAAVLAAIKIRDLVSEESEFPAARAGVQWGSMLYREGDYVGTVVNTASRLANKADRHQVLVTTDVRREAAGVGGVEFAPIGPARLKGVAEQIELFEARGEQEIAGDRAVDPVCGMELRPSEAAARLVYRGSERYFCSSDCLQRFVDDPDRYEAA
jgi:class 3 adenylate cyclase